MKNLDKLLSGLDVDEPPPAFDKRMARLFAAYPDHVPGVLSRPVPAWVLAAACVLCVCLGALLRSPFRQASPPSVGPTTVYVYPLPDTEAGRAFVTGPAAGARLLLQEVFAEGRDVEAHTNGRLPASPDVQPRPQT
ncbi:MAG: hypothetical protein JXR94_02185 [Candidatus Hydrogenedentes bacterium]|nr:hypothetical protein [Candidatus Hydrogenedentota bacterium]